MTKMLILPKLTEDEQAHIDKLTAELAEQIDLAELAKLFAKDLEEDAKD
jgi:hypothetical protein